MPLYPNSSGHPTNTVVASADDAIPRSEPVPTLENPHAKLGRAGEHLDVLREEMRAWIAAEVWGRPSKKP